MNSPDVSPMQRRLRMAAPLVARLPTLPHSAAGAADVILSAALLERKA